MSAIIIKADSQSDKLLKELAKKLGTSVISLDEEQYEDFILGSKMDAEKTNEMVSRESIMKKLKGK
jgi:hypothetical protein